MAVRWIDGNQQGDAEIVQHGSYITQNYYPSTGFLEVTCTMHPREYLLRELLDAKGNAFGLDGIRRLKNGDIESVPIVHTNREFIESYVRLIIGGIEKKARIPYPANTTLIVQCTLNRPYMPDEWGDLMSRVWTALPRSNFREIYLYDTVCQYSQTLYPR